MTTLGENTLKNLLTKALQVEADALEIEREDGHEEVYAMRGPVGVPAQNRLTTTATTTVNDGAGTIYVLACRKQAG